MSQPEDKIWVAIHRDTAFARVRGRATFKVGPALKQFGAMAQESGCKTILFDMEECVGMDSTFMGVLAGIAMRLKREVGGVMVLANLTPRTRGLVATLGLDNMVRAFEPGGLPENYQAAFAQSRQMNVIEGGTENRIATTETMLKAHEDLVAVDPRNLPRFKDVLMFLREDLKKAEAKARADEPA